MSKSKKTFRPKARNPRGFEDRYGAEIIAEREMLARICAVYEARGFDPLETPAFEYTEALGKFLPDVDRPNQGVFSIQDDDEQWMSLRYDLTAPLARHVAQNYDALPKPFRRYAVGSVWRNEKPGPGRFRQFTQCDADTVGAPAPHADVEACATFLEAIEAAGVAQDEFQLRINDRNVLTGLLETIGVDEAQDGDKKLSVLRAMDKLDRLGEEGVAALLGAGRKDESGDYTKGAELDDASIARVMDFMKASAATNQATCDALDNLIGASEAGAKGASNLAAMSAGLGAIGIDESRALIDLSIIRGLEYYTGAVFEADLTFEVEDNKGRPVRIGSVGGGGRYDGLVQRFKGVEVPAVGFSVGVSRLLTALSLREGATRVYGPIVILALEANQMPAYQSMAAELRAAGLRAEVYLGGSGMRAQMKYADKRGAPIVIIQGEDERAEDKVTIKDLVLGAELSKSIEDNSAWREDQPAQFAVARAELVSAVKGVMARERSS